MQPQLFSEDVSERIFRTTEKEILRMQEKIKRFQRKLSHLRDIHDLTNPVPKSERPQQMEMFG